MAHAMPIFFSLLCLFSAAHGEDLVTPRERAAHLLSASLQLKWASWSQRYPKVSPMDIEPSGEDAFRINGARQVLSRPSASLDRLPDVKVIGLVRDRSRPFLLLQTRRDDPIYLWATYAVAERRLRFIGYDKVERDLPADDIGDQGALVADLVGNLDLFKFLTTRSASNLNVIRDEISVRLACDSAFLTQMQAELEALRRRLPYTPVVAARAAEMQALININRRSFIDANDRTVASYCEPKRTQMWRDYLLELRVLTEYAIANVAPSEFAPAQRSSSSR